MTTYTYDLRSQPIGITYPAPDAAVAFAYDQIGRRTVMTDGQGVTTWTYDGADRPITITQPYVGAVGYSYDSAGDRLSLTYPDGKIANYSYDLASRLVQVMDWQSKVTNYSYNALGQPLNAVLPNGVTSTIGYDPAERLLNITHQGITQTLGSYTYTLDAVGNRVSVTETVLAPGTGISTTAIAYNYDPLYRLTSANYNTGSVYTYTYDAVGNRLSDAAPSGATTYTYDIANRLGTINGTINYTWDNNGNLVNNGQTVTYTYDTANRLIALSTNIYTFGYNGQGDRVVQLANGTPITYTLDLAAGLTQVLAETAATTTTTYLYGLARVAQQKASATDYFLPDALGSVRGLADANGNIMLAKSYDPFGQTISSSGSDSSNYDFTGEYKDGSALFYLRSRYYTSRRGRFLQKDSWAGNYENPLSLNAWAYSLSNPLKYTDPSGHRPCEGPDSGQCETPPYWQFFGDPFRLLQAQYGITLSNDGAKDWTQSNAWTVYNCISNIDTTLNGRLAANIKGANVTFKMDEHTDATGEYHGWTQGNLVTFYTQGAAAIRQQNIYHEFGHVLDSIPGLAHYSADLGTENRTNPSWLTANGELNAKGALIVQNIPDPNRGGTAEAIQHPCTCPVEQWADIFANYVAGNINRLSAKGADMYNWANQELTVNFAAP